MINLLQIFVNKKLVAEHKKCPKVPLGNSCAKIVYFGSEMILAFLCADSSIQNASEQFVWCIQLYFINFTLHPTQKQKI
jgi:hypothetical protein